MQPPSVQHSHPSTKIAHLGFRDTNVSLRATSPTLNRNCQICTGTTSDRHILFLHPVPRAHGLTAEEQDNQGKVVTKHRFGVSGSYAGLSPRRLSETAGLFSRTKRYGRLAHHRISLKQKLNYPLISNSSDTSKRSVTPH
ncbi:hypothetical protein SKAU_G00201060 [Synaphobranchus kaupii]|uniref:Uncharacterized protein n=1 Tax=Synaphobranchus kaupii TaxID=118154 RepID=A0A9Q1FFG8_SYNKA|nr:hypothetical protein SKAU_G00201060 [Synaphobranchus kaupii]